MKTILITGASGFLGKNLMSLIDKKQMSSRYNFLTPSSKELNLLDGSSVISYFRKHKPDAIIHAAAICGGIGLNKERPADLGHLNNKMTVNLFDAIREYQIKYFIGMGTVCSYPMFAKTPMKEEDMWGPPSEKTNRNYGEAKKMLISTFQAHSEQYGLRGVMLVSTNMYGFHDHFEDLQNNHVIPALINKFTSAVDTSASEVKCWGDGTATRDFVFATSVCRAILMALDNDLHYPEPINIGSGIDISIKDLALLIKEITGYTGEVIFTNEVSNGQKKRLLCVSRAKEVLGWEPDVDFRNGLIQTIDWYRKTGNRD